MAKIPWYVFLVLAVLSYSGIKYVFPFLIFKDVPASAVTAISETLAPISAILFLLLAGTALYKDDVASSADSTEKE